jgi:hypothetical protein
VGLVGLSEAAVREMLCQGEARIADLLTVSIAADERATTLSSSFGALAAGLFAADATILTIQKFDDADHDQHRHSGHWKPDSQIRMGLCGKAD